MLLIARILDTALEIRFDRDGLSSLLNACKSVLTGENACLPVRKDSTVFRRSRNKSFRDTLLHISLSPEVENSKLLINELGEIVLMLTTEDLEIAVERFEICSKKGYFSPAELMRIIVHGQPGLNDLFCVYSP